MADNPDYRDGRDDSRLNVNQEHEIQYWTQIWEISEAVLREAVAAAGALVRDVEAWLRRKGHISGRV